MNTQDQHQSMHVPLGSGGDTNMEILDQAIRDASAPTPGSTHKKKRRTKRTQAELLQAQTQTYQTIDARQDIMRAVRQAEACAPTLNVDDSLNRPEAGIADDDSNNQALLTARSDISSNTNASRYT